MKKAMIALAVVGMMGFAGSANAVVSASHTFTWSASVPNSPTSNGWVVSKSDGTEGYSGSAEGLTFSVDAAGKVTFSDSVAHTIGVYEVKRDAQGSQLNPVQPDETKPAARYKAKLDSLKVQLTGGSLTEQTDKGFFAIQGTSSSVTFADAAGASAGTAQVATAAAAGSFNLVKGTLTQELVGPLVLKVVKSAVAADQVDNMPKAGDTVQIQAKILIEDASASAPLTP